MRRRPLALLLLLALTACTAPGAPRPGAAPTDTPGVIVIASGRDVTGKDGVRQRLIDAWNTAQAKARTGYSARLVELPGSADEQRSQLLGALQSGSAAYDVVNLDVTWVPEFAAADLIEPLGDGLLDSDVIPSVAATARWDDRVYAAPFNSDVGLLYYRRDHLRAAGVQNPDLDTRTDWGDLLRLITFLGDRRPPGYERGWTTQLAAYEGRTVNAIEAFASVDVTLTDDAGRYTATATELGEGLAELRRRTGPATVLANATRSDEAASLADFGAGRTTFLRHWPSGYPALRQTFDGDELGVTALPGRAVLGGQNLAVTRTSRRTEKATELITYLTGRGSERCLLDAGFAATRTSAYTDAAVTCPVGAPDAPAGENPGGLPRDPAGRPEHAAATLLPALREAVQRPRTPLYGAFTQTLTSELAPLLTDDPPAESVLAERLDAALRRALPD
ncbi:extracellular solute-binding protein [Streptomyces sp. NPDC060194]|uniref:extracellular solute-binding protein n=1 Tax=Streptomyces sp. NPDC060194 TaxID=3347069 RepID=UPI003660D823